MEIVEDMLGVWPHVPLAITNIPAAIGHECDLAIHSDALLQQQFVEATARLVVMSDHEPEPTRPTAGAAVLVRLDDGLADDHLKIVRPIAP